MKNQKEKIDNKNGFIFQKKHATAASKGFTVLYAMLVASLLLSIGLSIYNILLKELVLSSAASDSQVAFFAADSGYECALYWDTKGYEGESIFPTTNTFVPPVNASANATMCNGANIMESNYPAGYNTSLCATPVLPLTLADSWCVLSSATSATTTFTVNYGASTGQTSCAIVTVIKNTVPIVSTSINSLGYNTCDTTDSRRVERAIQVSY